MSFCDHLIHQMILDNNMKFQFNLTIKRCFYLVVIATIKKSCEENAFFSYVSSLHPTNLTNVVLITTLKYYQDINVWDTNKVVFFCRMSFTSDTLRTFNTKNIMFCPLEVSREQAVDTTQQRILILQFVRYHTENYAHFFVRIPTFSTSELAPLPLV